MAPVSPSRESVHTRQKLCKSPQGQASSGQPHGLGTCPRTRLAQLRAERSGESM